MTNDQGDDDDSDSTVAGRSIERHVASLRTIAGQLEQIGCLLPTASRGLVLGLLAEAEIVSREAGIAFHDLAREINDIRQKD